MRVNSKESSEEKSTCEATLIADALMKGSKYTKEILPQIKNINAQDEEGNTALMRVVDHNIFDFEGTKSFVNNWDLLSGYLLLLESGADINIRNENGDTALTRAAGWHAYRCIELLFTSDQTNIDIEAKNRHGFTALLEAVHSSTLTKNCEKRGNLFFALTLRVLIINGADIEARDNNGDTALLMAIRAKDLETVRILLDHEANPFVKDQSGKTALELATELKLPRVSILLADRQVEYDKEPHIWRNFKKNLPTRAIKEIKKDEKNHFKFFTTSPAIFNSIISFLPKPTKKTFSQVNKDLKERLKTFAPIEASKKLNRLTDFLARFDVNVNRNDFSKDDEIAFKEIFTANKDLLRSLTDHSKHVNLIVTSDSINQLKKLLTTLDITVEQDLTKTGKDDAKENRKVIVRLDREVIARPNYQKILEELFEKYKDKLSHLYESAFDFDFAVKHKRHSEALKLNCLAAESKEDHSYLENLLAGFVMKNIPNAVVTLLDEGVNPNTINVSKGVFVELEPILHKSVLINNDIRIIKSLLAHGANINATDAMDRTALMRVAGILEIGESYCYSDLIYYLLLQKGAKIDMIDKEKETALSYTALRSNGKLVSLLIEEAKKTGIDAGLEWKNSKGQTPLLSVFAQEMEAINNHSSVFGSFTDNEYRLRFEKLHIKLLRYLAKYNVNFNAQDNNNCTALMMAVKMGNKYLVEYLLNHGANPILKDKDNQTALSLAQESTAASKTEIIQMLEKAIFESEDLILSSSITYTLGSSS